MSMEFLLGVTKMFKNCGDDCTTLNNINHYVAAFGLVNCMACELHINNVLVFRTHFNSESPCKHFGFFWNQTAPLLHLHTLF